MVERTQALADTVREAAPGAARRGAEGLRARAGEVRELADGVRGGAAERWQRLADDLPVETAVKRGRVAGWELVRLLGGLLVSGSGQLVRAARGIGVAGDEVADRSARAGERLRDLAGTVPPSRRARRRSRLRLAGWSTAAFSAGFAVGWVLARRQAPSVIYDPPTLLDPSGVGGSADSDTGDATAAPSSGEADADRPHG